VVEDLAADRGLPVCRACLRAARKQVGTGRLDDGFVASVSPEGFA